MINELYELSRAMQRSHVVSHAQHRSYLPIPNVTDKAPCIQIFLSGSSVVELHSLDKETAAALRKYGNNQGSYPAMNLASLYRITDEKQVKILMDLRAGKTTDFDLEELKTWCQDNNWCSKFLNKYKNSMQNKPAELQERLRDDSEHPIHLLCQQTECFQDPMCLRKELEQRAFHMLEQKMDIPTAIHMLFYLGKPKQPAEQDFGNLSVIFDSMELMDIGYSTISTAFTDRLNDALIQTEQEDSSAGSADMVDAFGNLFSPLGEPMPSVKLAGGFTASLRTMFEGQPCQSRYNRIGNDTYPISFQLRTDLQGALSWLSDASRRNKTWKSLNKDEILFAYPIRIPAAPVGLIPVLCDTVIPGDPGFEEAARRFLECLEHTKEPDTDSRADRIQIFILKKLDKARCKIVYTRNVTAKDVEQRSERWSIDCRNLPILRVGSCKTIRPMDVAHIMNWIWRRDAVLAADKFKPFHSYHGLDLFFDDGELAKRDLSVLLRNLEPAAGALGRFSEPVKKEIKKFRQSFQLLGCLLSRVGSRKEQYMQEFPYLYGQFLKVSDALHILYSRVVRKTDQMPTQLVGGSLYDSAAEMPLQTLDQLRQRMKPYLLWAKSYQYQNVKEEERESWRARWYLRLYETLSVQLAEQIQSVVRFTDLERAQLFLGYLAAFPKKERNENGGTEDEH